MLEEIILAFFLKNNNGWKAIIGTKFFPDKSGEFQSDPRSK